MLEIKSNGVYITKEVMKLIRIGEIELLKRVRDGRIKASLSGNKYIYLGKDLLAYIKNNQVTK
ncbi:MAG TPA: hypothetical protein VLH94_04165 [Spirochaetia bacterium]|nr:hypothetical protein [Spirochaetia bacterium]